MSNKRRPHRHRTSHNQPFEAGTARVEDDFIDKAVSEADGSVVVFELVPVAMKSAIPGIPAAVALCVKGMAEDGGEVAVNVYIPQALVEPLRQGLAEELERLAEDAG